MLIVSSLERAMEAYKTYSPTHIISILSEDEPRPLFPGLEPSQHLKLYVSSEHGGPDHAKTASDRTNMIIDTFEDWDSSGNVLIHCAKGVSRSMAAAFVLLCMLSPKSSEKEIAQQLREAAPHAEPCLFMIDHADERLGRDCRMFDAINDLPPSSTTIDAPIVLLSAAA